MISAMGGTRVAETAKGSVMTIGKNGTVEMLDHTATAAIHALVNYGALHCYGSISIAADWKGQVNSLVNYASASDANTVICIYEGATVTARAATAAGNGVYCAIRTQTPVHISGGTVSGSSYGCYLEINKSTAFAGDLNVTGGTVSGKQPIYAASAVTAHFSGGTVEVTDGVNNSGAVHLAAAAIVTVDGSAELINNSSGTHRAAIWFAADAVLTVYGGAVLQAPYPIFMNANGEVFLHGGALCVSKSGGSVIQIQKSGTNLNVALTITGGTMTGGDHIRANGVNVNNGATVTVNMSGGRFVNTVNTLCISADGAAVYMRVSGDAQLCGADSATDAALKLQSASTLHFVMTGGTVTSGNYGIWVARGSGAAGNITITNGSFLTENRSLSISGINSHVRINGGFFLSRSGDSAIDVSCDAESNTSEMCVYGGYFEGRTLAVARAYYNGYLKIYGGGFYYLPASNAASGNVVRVGAASSTGKLAVYGGKFYSRNIYGGIIATVVAGGEIDVNAGVFAGGLCPLDNELGGGTPSIHYPSGQNRLTLNGIVIHAGAQVRLVTGSSGLRFISTVDAASLAALRAIADEGSLSFGTLIVPTDYLAEIPDFTLRQLQAKGLQYLDLAALEGVTETADGGLLIRAAIVNIRPQNLNRAFSAVAYARYTINGHEVIVYADYREARHSRSIAAVSKAALNADQSGSLYSAAQRMTLLHYCGMDATQKTIDVYLIAGQSNGAGSTLYSQAFADSNPNFRAGYQNIYYAGNAATNSTGNHPNDKNIFRASSVVDFAPVSIGFGRCDTRIGAELGMAEMFSDVYNAESGREAIIVKYAVGGTSLSDVLHGNNATEGNWAPPSYLAKYGAADEMLSGGLHRNFMAQIADTIQDLQAKGYDVQIKGLYWMQGESDYKLSGAFDRYGELLDCLVNDFRTDIGALTGQNLSEMPILIGEISKTSGMVQNEAAERFIALQNTFAASKENVYTVPMGLLGVGTNASDLYHWGCDSMWLIGKTVGAMLLNLTGYETEIPATGKPAVAEVFDDKGVSQGTYADLAYAIGMTPAGGRVRLLCDITLYSALNVSNGNHFTLDGNGYAICSYAVDYGIVLVGCSAVFEDFEMTLYNNSCLIDCRDSAVLSVTSGSMTAAQLVTSGDGSDLANVTVAQGVFITA